MSLGTYLKGVLAMDGKGVDLDFWRGWLEENRDLFKGIQPGSRIGLVSRREFDELKGRVLIWEIRGKEVVPFYEDFSGFERKVADVLFVFSPGVVEEFKEATVLGEGSRLFKDFLRQKRVTFFSLLRPDELYERGYEDFFLELGLDYVRGCVG